MRDMVIIGAGECGTRAAFALREAGHTGTITLIGDEPHLPYERPPLSKPADDGARMKAICTADMLAAAGIDYRQGQTVTAVDGAAGVITLNQTESLPFGRLLLATGARPRRLTCPGAERALALRSHADAVAIFERDLAGRSVAVIGAGLIGMELAAVLRAKGAIVSVIETAAAILGRAVPPRFASALHQRHSAEGVIFHLGASLVSIDAEGVTLGDGTLVAADLVVAAIGVVPNVQLAERAGLATGNGILTDEQLCTSQPSIFAAGDCAAVVQPGGTHFRFESWRSARAQAELVARNMIGGAERFDAAPSFWSDQYDLGLQVVGWASADSDIVLRKGSQGEVEFYLRDNRLIAAAGLGSGNAIAKEIKLAEMLIGAGQPLDPVALADPAVSLKSFLRRAA